MSGEVFFGLIPVLNPIGLDTKKPQNYLIVRGLSRIFRFSSVIAAGALPPAKKYIVEMEGLVPNAPNIAISISYN